MKIPTKGLVEKLSVIAEHAFNKLSSPAFNIVISLVVIRMFSQQLWGEFISMSLAVNLAVQFTSWGHKEYLIKAFSQQPSNIAPLWQQAFILRVLLYVLCIPVFLLVLTIPITLKMEVIVWVFSLYLYRSFDVLVLYYRHFNLSTKVEFLGYVLLTGGIILFNDSDFSIIHLLGLNVAITLLKGIYLLFFYKRIVFQAVKLNLNILFFRDTLPFFLPSVIGFAQSKADIYVVALSLSRSTLAEYQIFIALLSVIHQVVLLALAPFTKNIYRLKDKIINRMAWRSFLWGFVASVLGMPVVYFIITFYYHFSLEWSVYSVGLLLIQPLFFYSIKTYQWFKHNDQYKVVAVNLVMTIVSLGLSIALIPSLGITGALLANCAAQWLAFFLFAMKLNKQKVLYETN